MFQSARGGVSLVGQPAGGAGGEGGRPLLGAVGQRRTFDQFEDERAGVVAFFQPVDRCEARMIQAG